MTATRPEICTLFRLQLCPLLSQSMYFTAKSCNGIPLRLKRVSMGYKCIIKLNKAPVVIAPRLTFATREVVCEGTWRTNGFEFRKPGCFPRDGFVPAKRDVIGVDFRASESLCKRCREVE